MKYAILALSLALALGPVAVLADDNNAPPPGPPQLTQAQRENLEKTFETYHTQMEQLHAQLRTQVLSSISPAHRTTIAGIIGNLAISSNPDPKAAARQIDTLLSQGEQQRIVGLHNTFHAQVEKLHQQMRAQLESQMPGGMHPGGNGNHIYHMKGGIENESSDAGSMVLKILTHPKGEMTFMHHMGAPMGGPPHR